MISGYKIINQNNDEDVLFLYLDFSFEFGGKKQSFFKTIKRFLKTINFKGTKILLVSSGIIIGTLYINPYKINKLDTPTNYNYVSKIIIHDFNENELTDYEININKDNKIQKGNILEKEKNDSVNNVTNVNIQKSNKLSNNIEENSTNKSNFTETKKDNYTETKKENIKKNEITVTVYRNNGKIINLELEEYVLGVVGAEMPASFNIEALKAQAILARTYALKSIKNGKKLTDTVSTQAYKDNSELQKLWKNDYTKYYEKIKKAVNETKGKVILYNNEYIDAVYHSTSNGKTENSKNVWKNILPYLVSVDSSWDKNVKSYKKETIFEINEFCNILKLDVEEPITYEIIHNETGRVRQITINNKTFSGTEFRNLLKLRSADFEIEINDEKVKVTTYGYGHGVGMSQYGANEMAKQGYSYIQILKHYYTGVVIK
jgi:stage II sporulation protein D